MNGSRGSIDDPRDGQKRSDSALSGDGKRSVQGHHPKQPSMNVRCCDILLTQDTYSYICRIMILTVLCSLNLL
jgi:hypothetical protein